MYYLSDICALCLIPSQNLISILSLDSDGTVVQEKLQIFFMELVNFKPNLPKYICINCLKNLNNINKFRLRCIENIKTLNKYINKFEVNEEEEEEEGLLPKNQNISEIHENEMQISSAQKNIVVECIKEEPEETQNIFHENTNRIDLDIHSNLSNYTTKKESVQTQDNVMKQEHKNTFDNIQTPYETFQAFNEEIHIKEDNNIANIINTTTTDSVKNNARGNQDADKNKKFKCNDCQKTFCRPSLLERHRRIHTGDRPYRCTICQKTFKQPGALSVHMHTHKIDKPFACDVCQSTFRQQRTLIIHRRIHSNERPYKCYVCSKTFKVNNNLTVHMRTHTGDRPYHCHQCSYKCTTSGDLKRHIRKHTGEKPYTCQVCQMTFVASNNLQKHIRRKHQD